MKRLVMMSILALAIPTAIFAQGNAFSFQGRLNDGATPANGAYDLEFRLYAAIQGGTQIGTVVPRPNTPLINGVFSVTLDFGSTAFNSPNAVFIEIAVRPNGSPNAYTILGPRQQLTVVPFAVRAANATNADTAVTLNGLGPTDFIRNSNNAQAANFFVSGLGRATYGQFDQSLGIGVAPNLDYGLDVVGHGRFKWAFGNVDIGTPNGETGISITGFKAGGAGRGDLRLQDQGGILKLVNGPGGIPPSTNGIAIDEDGKVGIGTIAPKTRLSLFGGVPWTPSWTASMNLQSASAIGWEANTSGQRFGIGTNTGGMFFFRTGTPFGQTGAQPNYDMVITDTGNITQSPGNFGLVKAMLYVNPDGSVPQCYNALLNSVTGTCGFVVTRTSTGTYSIDFNQAISLFVSVTSGNAELLPAFQRISPNVVIVKSTVAATGTPFDDAFTVIVY